MHKNQRKMRYGGPWKKKKLILSLSSSRALSYTESTSIHDTNLRRINTTTHRQTVCCHAARFTDPQAPLWGHLRPGCCPLSPSLFSSLSTPFHHHFNHLLWNGGLFIVPDEHLLVWVCDCTCIRHFSQRQFQLSASIFWGIGLRVLGQNE